MYHILFIYDFFLSKNGPPGKQNSLDFPRGVRGVVGAQAFLPGQQGTAKSGLSGWWF